MNPTFIYPTTKYSIYGMKILGNSQLQTATYIFILRLIGIDGVSLRNDSLGQRELRKAPCGYVRGYMSVRVL